MIHIKYIPLHMPFVKLTFADVVEWHTEHQFLQEMAKESVVVKLACPHILSLIIYYAQYHH